MLSCQTIRQQMRIKRDSITLCQRHTSALSATALLVHSPMFLRSQYVGCYMPFGSELNTLPLIHYLWQMGKNCYLPVIDRIRPDCMVFVRYCQDDMLKSNAFGILEPYHKATVIPPWALQLVIMPLLAFDHHGNRLGSGCGYYDRVFGAIDCWSRAPVLCGFAYSCQEIKRLPQQPWDVAVNVVVSEDTLIQCN